MPPHLDDVPHHERWKGLLARGLASTLLYTVQPQWTGVAFLSIHRGSVPRLIPRDLWNSYRPEFLSFVQIREAISSFFLSSFLDGRWRETAWGREGVIYRTANGSGVWTSGAFVLSRVHLVVQPSPCLSTPGLCPGALAYIFIRHWAALKLSRLSKRWYRHIDAYELQWNPSNAASCCVNDESKKSNLCWRIKSSPLLHGNYRLIDCKFDVALYL